MKKLFILLLVSVIMMVVFQSYASNRFILNGKINGLSTTETAILSYYLFKENKSIKVSDTIRVINNSFVFKGDISEPVNANLVINELDISFYLEPTNMHLYLEAENSIDFQLIGSKTQEDYLRFNQNTEQLYALKDEVGKQISDLREIEVSDKNNEKKHTIETKKDELRYINDSLNKEIAKQNVYFSRTNPDSFISLDPVMDAFQREILTLQESRVLFNSFSPEIQNTTLGERINKHLKKEENTLLDSIAPDFRVINSNNEIIQLSDFRGENYVLLDFWATWCGPCIEGIPHLKELYKKYSGSGLAIISISCDYDYNSWIAGIEKYKLNNWTHVSHIGDIENMKQGIATDEDIAEKYPTMGIPKYFIIDLAGKIIGRWDGYSPKQAKELDKLLEEIYYK